MDLGKKTSIFPGKLMKIFDFGGEIDETF